MASRITHIRLSGGEGHVHITRLQWMNQTPTQGSTVEVMDQINRGQSFYVENNGHRSEVGVVDGKYIRSHADGYYNNNLLSLPRF